ncbi:MAG: NUDIX hydrolase, partial [Helicobacter sp.]|nr:NUDIX hydrolase [Helicobacter sp.]
MKTPKITNVQLRECKDSSYIKPIRMLFNEHEKQRSWDIIQAHDSVSILLYHIQKESFVIVKQFRPAVYLKQTLENSTLQEDNDTGYTYELCAGITDKQNKSLQKIAQEEILEECGYDVPLEKITKITEFYSSVGFAGSKQTLFFAEIVEEYKIGEGGGINDENIEIILIPKAKAHAFIF